MINLRIGQKLRLTPAVLPEKFNAIEDRKTLVRECTVIYINEEHRYFTVRFDYEEASVNESFKF